METLFVDIEGAFDNAIPSIFIAHFIILSVPDFMVNFIKNLIFDREGLISSHSFFSRSLMCVFVSDFLRIAYMM